MKPFYLFIGGPEIFVVVLIIVMLFGADKIPEIARGLGKGIRQIKDATDEIKKEINESSKKQGIDTKVVKDIDDELKEVKNTVNNLSDSIKRH